MRGASSIKSHAVGAQPLELRVEVGDLERDVVQARAALREERAHRRVGAERPQQLEARAAHAQRGGLDALLLDDLPVLDLAPKSTAYCSIDASRSATAIPSGGRSSAT